MSTPLYLVELTAQAWPRLMRSGVPGANGTRLLGKTQVAVSSAVAYRITARVRRSATADGRLYVGIQVAGSWSFIAASNVVANTTFTTYSATFGFGTANPLPAGTSMASPLVALNFASSLGYMECSEIWIERTAAPGVEISADRYVRDATEWDLYVSSAPTWPTWNSDGDAQSVTLRYATAAYMTWPSDTPAKTQYPARVINPGLLRSELPAGFAGAAASSFGEIVLNNADGALGELAYYGLDGQPFRVLMGHSALDYAGFVEILAGTMQQATVDRKQVRVRLAGRDAVLDRPLLDTRYLGNNALPNGLEGGAELEGQLKPVLIGAVGHIAPPCVNTARDIYQVSSGGLPIAVNGVFDAGAPLLQGAVYASQADMETNAPAAGYYRTWPAGGYFRLGSAPAGLVTCAADATESGYGTYWWWIALYQLANYWGGLQSGEIRAAKNAAVPQPDNWAGAAWSTTDQAAPGVWVSDGSTTIRQVMAQMATSVGAWFGFTHWDGLPGTGGAKFGGEIFPPSSAGLVRADYCNLDESNCAAITGVADPGQGRGVPAYSVELTHSPNDSVLTPSMAPSLPPTGLGFLGIASRRVNASSTAVRTKHLQARAVVRETRSSFNPSSLAVSYEATRLLELWRQPRQWFEVRVALQALLDQTPRPRLGGYVALSFPELRCLWQDGFVRNWGWFSVMALEINMAKSEVRMTLRQATEQSI